MEMSDWGVSAVMISSGECVPCSRGAVVLWCGAGSAATVADLG